MLPMFTHILLGLHIVSSALWVGAVFMGSIIDPPALRQSTEQQQSMSEMPSRRCPPGYGVLVSFIVYQGSRIFPWVYTAMTTIFITGIILTWLHPPQRVFEMLLVGGKFIALGVMAGNTLYGTLVTWPKIQFATPDEVQALWGPYLIRAYITLGCGLAAFIMSVIIR